MEGVQAVEAWKLYAFLRFLGHICKQSHLFHQIIISKQLLCGLTIRNIDSAETGF